MPEEIKTQISATVTRVYEDGSSTDYKISSEDGDITIEQESGNGVVLPDSCVDCIERTD